MKNIKVLDNADKIIESKGQEAVFVKKLKQTLKDMVDDRFKEMFKGLDP